MPRTPWQLLPSDPDEGKLWLTWLVRLRWLALFAQAVTLAFVFQLLQGAVPILAWLGTMAVLGLANLWAIARQGRAEEVPATAVLGQLLIDVLALTTFFAVGGGPDNPFTPLYLVHIAMAAVMLPPRFSAVVATAVLAGYSGLFLGHYELAFHRHSLPEFVLVRLGRWLAFVLTSLSIAVFVVGIASSLRRRKEQLLDARDRSARTDRLRSVGTLAAGAAHELNTPLSTLTLRLRRIGRRHGDVDTLRDLEAAKEQLDRCTSIVQRLLVGAGDPSASDMERRPLGLLVSEAVGLWSKGSTMPARVEDRSVGLEVEVPGVAFQQALINLLENAREAQEAVPCFDPIEVRVYRDELDHGVVELLDRGCGLPEHSEQVGEPFYTTKASGTGLGVFVARAVADGVGGGLQYAPRDRAGTVARWWFPEARRRTA
jgi:two-component system, sensor histidine kinase RegB